MKYERKGGLADDSKKGLNYGCVEGCFQEGSRRVNPFCSDKEFEGYLPSDDCYPEVVPVDLGCLTTDVSMSVYA